MSKVKTCLWVDGDVDAMIDFYRVIFPELSVGNISRLADESPGVPGNVLVAELSFFGHDIMILNGGPHYSLSPAVSLFVSCSDQAEVDHYWDRLVDGGEASRCGWLTDRFGVSWQIVPRQLGAFMADPDPQKSGRVTQAMLQMVKLDVAALEPAYNSTD